MASVAAVTPTVTGAACAGATCTAGVACLVTFTTAQSALDFSKLTLMFSNATSTASVITMVIGENFSEIGQGVGDTITVGTSTSATAVVLAGAFESARLQNSSGYLSFSPATADVTCRAILSP